MATVQAGDSNSFGNGFFNMASLGRVGTPLDRGQYSPDKDMIGAGERSRGQDLQQPSGQAEDLGYSRGSCWSPQRLT